MSAPLDLAPGDLIVFEQRSSVAGVYAEHNVARVDLVRERDCSAFPWRMGDRAWDKRRHRIVRAQMLATLPAEADVAAIAEDLNVLRNQREMERASANVRFERRVNEKLALSAARLVR